MEFDTDNLRDLAMSDASITHSKNQKKQIEEQQKQNKLLEEQMNLEKKRLRAEEEQLDIEKERMNAEENHRREQADLERFRLASLKKGRNLLADAGLALDSIESQFQGLQ
jgi:hypothetical protein